MSSIRTYQDLLKEERRLSQQLKIHEGMIKQDIAGLQENLEPVKKAFNTVNKIFTRDNRVPVFNIGLELGIDVVLRKLLLAKAGWLTKILIPYLVKNYSSHILGEEKRKIMLKKVRDFFAKFRPRPASSSAAEQYN